MRFARLGAATPSLCAKVLSTMTILTDAGVASNATERIQGIDPSAQQLWGRMSVGGMLCHLNDAFVGVSSLRGPDNRLGLLTGRWILRPFALYMPLRWPHGVPTPPPIDQLVGGTPPADFAEDKARLIRSLNQFAATDMAGAVHPYFGPLSQWEWMRWGWLHADHHLRQFSA